MSAIDPTIQALIENGRQAAAVRHEKEVAAVQARQEAEYAEWDKAWNELETAVARQLPAEITRYALSAREHNVMPGVHSVVIVGIEHLHPFRVMVSRGSSGWFVNYFYIERKTITGEVDSHRVNFKFDELHLCLAEVARLTEWRYQRRTMQLDYEMAVDEWLRECDAVTAVYDAMIHTMQTQVCEHYGDSFALWQVHYSYFEDGEVQTDTAVVLENETDALGFWRVVSKSGKVRRIAYTSVYAVEELGDFDVTAHQYARPLWGNKIGVYLPPYITETEFAAAQQMLATAEAHAPELPEKPRPHGMAAAVLFEEWELDWLYHNTGGDAAN
jgi:hypothetical protein